MLLRTPTVIISLLAGLTLAACGGDRSDGGAINKPKDAGDITGADSGGDPGDTGNAGCSCDVTANVCDLGCACDTACGQPDATTMPPDGGMMMQPDGGMRPDGGMMGMPFDGGMLA